MTANDPVCYACFASESRLNDEGRQLYICDMCGVDCCSDCSEDGPHKDLEVLCLDCHEEMKR